MNSRDAGRWGERKAAEYLKTQGYELLETGYQTRFGEIDLICAKDGVVAFVEVKMRKDSRFAHAREFVTKSKQKKIIISAQLWLQERSCRLQPRFDVVEVYAPEGAEGKVSQINHLVNAFW